MHFRFKRFLVWSNRQLALLKERNSGDWVWLSEKPVPIASLNRSIWRAAEPSLSYYVLLFLSTVLATLGLLANSTATIIGAMIVAPLMGPIVGIAFSMVMSNRRLLKRSSLSLSTGILLAIITALGIGRLIGFDTLTPEIQARVSPNLLDLGVALAAGAAGAYAKSRRGISDALPGVAIAVALVPPLSVVGIGLSLGSNNVTLGALLLFSTNLAGIIFSGGVIFLWQRYGSIQRAQRGLAIAVITLITLGIPLGFSFQDLVLKQRTRQEISTLIRNRTLTFANKDIRGLNVRRQSHGLLVDLEVVTEPGSISENQVSLVKKFLERAMDRPITLNVTVIPVERFNSTSDLNKRFGDEN